MTRYFLLLMLTVTFSLGCTGSTHAVGVSELKAFFREGQTFVTWQEDESVKGEWYKVYASTKPITDVSQATLVAKVPEDSRLFRWAQDGSRLIEALGNPKYLQAVQLEDDINSDKALPAGTGVYVRTIKQAAETYYAVTVEREGKEDAVLRAGSNTLQTSIRERVETPGAILIGRGISDSDKEGTYCHVYLFFTDYAAWNPDKIDDNWEGYAHIMQVGTPPNADGKTKMPLTVRLHHWGTGVPVWKHMKPTKGRVELALLDYNRTWWYGYSDSLPQTEGRAPVNGIIHNFTEQRVLQAVAWLTKGPPNCNAHVDPMAVSVQGASMGGTGVNFLGARHGDVFAGGHASKGMTSWAVSPEINRQWYKDIMPKFGPYERNDMTNEGVPVYDLLNMPKWLEAHPEKDVPFLDMANGITDFVIVFHSTPDYWRGLEKGKHPYAAYWRPVDHSGLLSSGTPMDYQLMRLDEPIPAFANASSNDRLRSGFRAQGTIEKMTPKSITISTKKLRGRSPRDCDFAGKTLIIAGGQWEIAGSEGDTITIKDGDLVAYDPEPVTLTRRGLAFFVKANKREPTPEDLKRLAIAEKQSFLVVDGATRGQRNGYFAWSSRHQNFSKDSTDHDTIDETDRFAISMKLEPNRHFGEYKGEHATADVTPRRCQNFKPAPGVQVHWQNISFADPANPETIAEGTVNADKHGLVTIPAFLIGKKGFGNRLVLTLI